MNKKASKASRNFRKEDKIVMVERVSDCEILIRDQFGRYCFVRSEIHDPSSDSYNLIKNNSDESFNIIQEINLEKLIISCETEIKRDKKHSFFKLEKHKNYELLNKFGNLGYVLVDEKDKKFNKVLCDDDFHLLKYTDITGGPLNKKTDNKSWSKEIKNVINNRFPREVIFYLRKDASLNSARILITIQDFYKGLTREESIEKYGEHDFNKMFKHLDVLKDCYDGVKRISYIDLDNAYKKIK